MDYYISEFYKLLDGCTVKDYAVYLEKKTGVARFNPFSTSEQMVIYLTNRGSFCLFVRGAAEFTQPVAVGERFPVAFSQEGKIVECRNIGKQYGFSRKWKQGCCGSRMEFADAVNAR